jgi:cardiolipin synthase
LIAAAQKVEHYEMASYGCLHEWAEQLAIQTLVAACKRGVKLEIIVPGPVMDSRIVQRASRSLWGALLDGGVEIHEYQPTMYHCKVLIVDDVWVSVGSTNFDDRSFRLNDEANKHFSNPIQSLWPTPRGD